MKTRLNLACAASLLLSASALNATTINYDLVSLGGNDWKYTNNLIFFPSESSADNFNYTIGAITTPPGWTSFKADASAPDLGAFVEWYGDSILPGHSANGFEVEFTYTGTERLGAQTFE